MRAAWRGSCLRGAFLVTPLLAAALEGPVCRSKVASSFPHLLAAACGEAIGLLFAFAFARSAAACAHDTFPGDGRLMRSVPVVPAFRVTGER